MKLILAAAVAALLAMQVQQTPPPTPTPAPEAQKQAFEQFLAGVRSEALALGIRESTLNEALKGLEPSAVIIARDRQQPEATQSLDDYVAVRLSPQRKQSAAAMAKTHAALLARIEEAYGLPPEIMVSIWGLESNFGSFTGSYPTVMALATLAYDGRRALFRTELFSALRMIDQGRATAADMKGSWAGAMGQPQFMPSSYLRHAVDFDGDGKADIWSSVPDVFASMANYLKAAGWKSGDTWGREVSVERAVMDRIERTVAMRTSGCRAIREMTVARPLAEWRKIGVTAAGGQPLPFAGPDVSLVRGQSRFFLVTDNYFALLGYNCSNSYAVSVGLLADTITQ